MSFRACLCLSFALCIAMGLVPASRADDWGNLAAVSSTMGVYGGRVCVGEATRGDIGCPAYAPVVGADGSISASGFMGDGSGLTGVIAGSSDRIVSGTTSMLAVSNTGFVSLTQAGTNTGWFDPTRGLVTLGVSATGAISGTRLFAPIVDAGIINSNGYPAIRITSGGISGRSSADYNAFVLNPNSYSYFRTDLGLGGSFSSALAPSATLHVLGDARISSWTMINSSATPTVPLEVSGTVRATQFAGRFVGDGSGLTNLQGASADRVVSGTTAMVAISNTGFISLTQAATNTGWFDPMRGLVTLGVSATGGISGTTGYFTRDVGFGTQAPSATLHAMGDMMIDGTAAQLTLRSSVTPTFGISLGFNTDTNIGTISSRALSSTRLGLLLNNTFFIKANSNDVGIAMGSAAPSATLHVGGNVRINSWTVIGANKAATAPLEVVGNISSTNIMASGTVYATSFVGDGSGLTNLQGASVDRVVSGTTSLVAVSNTGFVSLTQAGTNTGWFDPNRGLVTLGVSTTGSISGTRGYFSAGADVSGTMSATMVSATLVKVADVPGLPCTPERYGTIRYENGRSAMCMPR